MGKQRTSTSTSLANDNLTISRIHVILRPFETKLNVLAKTLERKIAADKYAPKARQPGVTYAKRHRIRAMTGMNSRQAGRAYALEKSKGLSTLYSFHEPLIGVEDAFRNLIRGIPLPRDADERVPSLQALVCQMIGRQVAEETLRDKEELEAEGVDDCIGLWYGGLSVNSRKHALIAHAVQLVELKIPFFILGLWTGLLTITIQAGLLEESYILLEYILLYYFTPDNSVADCPAANMTGRDLTDLYNTLTGVHSFPPAEFFAILLPIIEAYPNLPAIWSFRCIQHLIRNLDGDIILLTRVADCMARTLAACSPEPDPTDNEEPSIADTKKLVSLVESKTYEVLALLANSGSNAQSTEMVREVGHLAWTTHHVGKMHGKERILGLSLALDVSALVLHDQGSTGLDASDITERLSHLGGFDEGEYTALVKALYTAHPTSSGAQPSPNPESYLKNCASTLRAHGLIALADALKRCQDEIISRGDDMRLRLAPPPSGLLKRSRLGQRPSKTNGSKRRKTGGGWKKGGESEECTETEESESEVATEWSASVDGEDSAGEQDNNEEDDEVTTEEEQSDSRTADDEEEMEDDSDAFVSLKPRVVQQPPHPVHPKRRPTGHSSTSIHLPPPVLRTVVSAKVASALVDRLVRRTHERERERAKALTVSSEDDLDLLRADRRRSMATVGSSKTRKRRADDPWSTP
ncbi:hypothetical protein M408DRAFT_144616 [Serendipita vermifera MAFF 305830]|uniref:Uncharacterized protein n=1 Tax=Serendipita vermifera MAFF 305830 TaxID=933852 RepID=A0A0C3B7X7_SERVB|nr:hypothetical protein M408DRAFT_144616 [Serendipita vermifera MAFF 305830]